MPLRSPPKRRPCKPVLLHFSRVAQKIPQVERHAPVRGKLGKDGEFASRRDIREFATLEGRSCQGLNDESH